MTGPVRLAGVGPTLSPIALGANHLGSALDHDASFALLDRFVDLGGTVVDTALVYADWLPEVERSCSERTIGRWLAARGMADEIVVATKGGHPDLRTPGVRRLDPASLRSDVGRSLDHLGLPQLPLWWLHRDDPDVSVGEIVDAVDELCSSGSVGSWGVANWAAPRLAAARQHAAERGVRGPVASSVGFSLAPPSPGSLPSDLVTLDPALAELHRQTEMPLLAYSAQAKGWFDKMASGRPGTLARSYGRADAEVTAAEIIEIARRYDASPTEVALAGLWLLPFPVAAVVGPRTATQLDSCWRAAGLELADEDMARLGRLAAAAVRAAG